MSRSGPAPADHARVRELLGREPRGRYEVVVRDADGDPIVLRNAPLLDDGTPMPTRYWLVGPNEVRQIGRLEAAGGVDAAEAAVDPDELVAAHDRYAAERDADLPADHEGPRPTGGVGGTRTGVKCLHAHWAWHLAGGDDPVGRWIERQLAGEPAAGALHVAIAADSTVLRAAGGDSFPIPWGDRTLARRWLLDDDPPRPESLTNALAAIADHLDDVLRERPDLLDTTTVEIAGDSAVSLAAVELGSRPDVDRVELSRDAAEEIFRIVATETATDRAHNPGLPSEHVNLIVATCCIVLAVMRRLHLDAATVVVGS